MPGAFVGAAEVQAESERGRGYPVETIRHAQAAGEWDVAARSLAGHWPGLHLDGQVATTHELLAGFPVDVRAADAELGALVAADELPAW